MVRMFPQTEWKWIHRYQYIYMWLLYPIYTIVWLLTWDIKDFLNPTISGRPYLKIPLQEKLKMTCGKIIFVLRLLILPVVFGPFTFPEILLGFFVFHLAASSTVAFVLVSAHVGELNQFPKPNEQGILSHSWIRHQLVTTCDFSTNNMLLSHLYGCFNHHVIHHIFPHINHIHYPALTKILKDLCNDFDMHYNEQPSLTKSIGSHFSFLKARSRDGVQVEYLEL